MGEPRGLDALMDSELLADAPLIVNATSMGLTTGRFARLDYSSTAADCLFYDLINAAQPTELMKPALAAGRQAADGAGMLVNQGELAFKLFNRIAPPAGVMRAALFNALGRSLRALTSIRRGRARSLFGSVNSSTPSFIEELIAGHLYPRSTRTA